MRVRHQLLFSTRASRMLRKAMRARRKVRLAVDSTLRADLDGDGRTDARSAQRVRLALVRPTTKTKGSTQR